MSETNSAQTESTTTPLPSPKVLQHASKLAIVEDKPVMFDYWVDSLNKSVFIGVRDSGEKLLVKNEEEYTSHVAKIFRVGDEYIIMTENSIYVASASIATKRIH